MVGFLKRRVRNVDDFLKNRAILVRLIHSRSQFRNFSQFVVFEAVFRIDRQLTLIRALSRKIQMNRWTFAASLALCGFSTSLLTAQDSENVFTQLDKNNDGILVADEIPEAQQRFFDRLIRTGDQNEDGKLSKAEYAATLKNDEQPAGDPGRGPGRPGDRRPGAGFGQPGGQFQGRMTAEAFARMDRNNDGKLTKDEIPEQARERFAQMFERLGTDSIDLERFQALSRQGGDRPGQRGDLAQRPDGQRPPGDGDRPRIPGRDGNRPGPDGQMNRGPGGAPGFGGPDGRPGFGGPGGPGFGGQGGPAFLRILDENHDGNISKEEALRVAKLFDELDRNNDGQLNMPELMGFAGDGFPGPMGREGDRLQAGGRPDRPRIEGDRPRGDGDRPRPEGDRPEGARPPGERGFGVGGRGTGGFGRPPGGFGWVGQLLSEDTRDELKLTDEQVNKIRELGESGPNREQMTELFSKMREANSQEDREKLQAEMREIFEKTRAEQDEKLKQILSEEQFDKATEMRNRRPEGRPGGNFGGPFGRPDGDRRRPEGDRPEDARPDEQRRVGGGDRGQGGFGGQQRGGNLFAQLRIEGVSDELKLTEEQQDKLEKAIESDTSMEQVRDLFSKVRDASSEEERNKLRDELNERMAPIRAEQEKQLKEILTDEQFNQFMTLTRERAAQTGFRGGFGRPDRERSTRPQRPESE